MAELEFAVDDPRSHDSRALLEIHLAFAHDVTPPEHVHALDIDGLLDPAVTFFSVRRRGALVGVAALKQHDDGHAEIKSMHVAAAARGHGIGLALVEHLLRVSRERMYERVSLETGAEDVFAPARALYAKAGFVVCEPFAQYTVNPYSICMTIYLDARG